MSDHFRDRMKGGGSGHLNINRTAPEQLIHLHIAGEDVTISLDLVGKDALFKRGYRAPRARAPLNEVLTAVKTSLSGARARGARYPRLNRASLPTRSREIVTSSPAMCR